MHTHSSTSCKARLSCRCGAVRKSLSCQGRLSMKDPTMCTRSSQCEYDGTSEVHRDPSEEEGSRRGVARRVVHLSPARRNEDGGYQIVEAVVWRRALSISSCTGHTDIGSLAGRRGDRLWREPTVKLQWKKCWEPLKKRCIAFLTAGLTCRHP